MWLECALAAWSWRPLDKRGPNRLERGLPAAELPPRSAFEDRSVEFDDEVVIGTIEDDGRLVFEIGVTPTESGAHPINGVMRVSFANGNKSESKPSP